MRCPGLCEWFPPARSCQNRGLDCACPGAKLSSTLLGALPSKHAKDCRATAFVRLLEQRCRHHDKMEDSSKAPSSTFALSNLTQTNALPLLPLPEDPFEPSYDFQEASERLDAFSRDPELLLELQGLLQAADVTSM